MILGALEQLNLDEHEVYQSDTLTQRLNLIYNNHETDGYCTSEMVSSVYLALRFNTNIYTAQHTVTDEATLIEILKREPHLFTNFENSWAWINTYTGDVKYKISLSVQPDISVLRNIALLFEKQTSKAQNELARKCSIQLPIAGRMKVSLDKDRPRVDNVIVYLPEMTSDQLQKILNITYDVAEQSKRNPVPFWGYNYRDSKHLAIEIIEKIDVEKLRSCFSSPIDTIPNVTNTINDYLKDERSISIGEFEAISLILKRFGYKIRLGDTYSIVTAT